LKISINPANFLCLLWKYTTTTTRPIAATPAISANVKIQSRILAGLIWLMMEPYWRAIELKPSLLVRSKI
jgi:hypothetical protein